MTDPGADPDARLRALGREIATRVEAVIPGYLSARVGTVIDAWGRLPAPDADALRAAVRDAGPRIASETASDLVTLFAIPAAEQRRTPLEVVAGMVAVPTQLLEAAGIPDVVRDAVDERVRPDDRYDLAPRTLADLGDPDLGPLQLAWGLAKHRALRQNP